MKRILILFLLTINIFASFQSCTVDKALFQKELVSKYENSLVQLEYLHDIKCLKVSNKKEIMAHLYIKAPSNMVLVIIVFDPTRKEITQTSMNTMQHPFLTQKNSPNVHFEKKRYRGVSSLDVFGVELEIKTQRGWKNYLFLYELNQMVTPLLEDFLIRNHLDPFGPEIATRSTTLSIHQSEKNKFLLFKQMFNFAYEDKGSDWTVDVEDKKLFYKNGKYIDETEFKPIFDLEQIEANSKKGLKYKKVVLDAMLLYRPVTLDNVEQYNNIGYYLKKAGHLKEAMRVLEEVVCRVPTRTVAYYNLANSYWEISNKIALQADELLERDRYVYKMDAKALKIKAIASDKTYIEQMKKKGKAKKIPKKVLKRIQNSQEIAEDREQVKDILWRDASVFKYLSDALRSDKEVAQIALEHDPFMVEYLGTKLQENRELWTQATDADARVLKLLPSYLKADKSFMYHLIKKHGSSAWEYLDKTLKEDKIFLLRVLKLNSDYFIYFPDEIKRDKKLLFKFVKEHKVLPKGYDKEVLKDKAFMLEILPYCFDTSLFNTIKNEPEVGWLLMNRLFNRSSSLSINLQKDKEFINALLYVNADNLKYADKTLKEDKFFIKDYFQKYKDATLKYVGQNLKVDKEIVKLALIDNAWDFRNIDKHLQKDRELIYLALSKNPFVIKELNAILRNEPHIKQIAIDHGAKKYRHDLKYLELIKPYLTDRETILKVVKNNGGLLEYLDLKWRDDREIALLAIKDNLKAFRYAGESIKQDKNLLLDISEEEVSLFKYMDKKLGRDREFMLKMVKKNGLRLQYASSKLQKDRELVLSAMKQNGNAIKFAHPSFYSDKSLMLMALKRSGKNFTLVNYDLRMDRDIALTTLKHDGMQLWHMREEQKRDRELVLTAIRENGEALRYATDKSFLEDKELVLEAMDTAPKEVTDMLRHKSSPFLKDKEVMLKAVSLKGQLLSSYYTFRYEKKFIELALKTYGRALSFAKPNSPLHKNRALALLAIAKDSNAIKDIDKSFRDDKEIMLLAIKQKARAYYDIGDSLKDDREIALATVQKDGLLLRILPYRFKKDKGIVMEAIKNTPTAFQYASYLLAKDSEVVILLRKKEGMR